MIARVAAAAAAAGLVTALGAAPASAHTTLRSATPAPNSTGAAPSRIVLTYADPVMVPQIVLTDGAGARHAAGKAEAVDNTVTVPVTESLPGGRYTVGWRVVASDGHPVTGTFKFTVQGAGGGVSAAGVATPEPEDGSGGSSGWLWVGLGALLVALAGGGVVWARRARG
ncbi:copper resistance protein CopC [Actinomadura sp. NEAU-AAG7]|uniref:copper resistance CopC family protein n=1 Tax=Actinomadura sp. NEAU-AAG7 TaxID=2839640 RepID=UPI001BE3E412|nr:copper resistance protein CopC [Actinomadura sp. NEAU-AAG7]MBT2207408.1 copper resistance protein CopC [Actinomadura sp. NEAU-AAG7]